jgi:hypothetical protein
VYSIAVSIVLVICIAGCTSAPARAVASDLSRVDTDIKAYDEYLARSENAFSKIPANARDKEWVKKKIAHMFEVDQYMRHYTDIPFLHKYTEDEKSEFMRKFMLRFNELDEKDTADLKALLDIYYWFKISEFGAQTDNQAWLIVQHADLQIDFQKMVLARLATLYKTNETKPSNYAYLFDRIASSSNDPSKRVPQRYGTQGSCTGPGTWVPWPSEDEVHLDSRRAEVGLGTESDYIAIFKDICH